jgi:hypothetical protein
MSSLQLSPLSGVPAATPSGSPVGEAVATPPTSHDSAPQASSVQAAADAAAAARAAAKAAAEANTQSPAYDLQVGLVHGTFDVYVDLADKTSHHVIARLYGPPDSQGEVVAPPTAPPANASGAYTRHAAGSEPHSNIQTDV